MVMAGTQPLKKSNACVPCHERKVRCDSALVGLPCSRCKSKNRGELCTQVSRRKRSSNKRSQRSTAAATQERPPHPPSRTDLEEASSEDLAAAPPHNLQASEQLVNEPIEHPQDTSILASSLQHPPSSSAPHPIQRTQALSASGANDTPRTAHNDTPYQVSEEDAHVQMLYRMGQEDTPTNISAPVTGAVFGQEQSVFEYFDRLSSVSVLGEALGHRQRKRLVQIDLPGQDTLTNKDNELAGIDAVDVAYLNSKRVFELPPMEACIALLRLFFDYIHPYTPILDRVQFCEEFASGNCSHFLSNAIFANTIPYAPIESIIALGYSSRDSAQRDFVLKAQLAHDFGCEKRQLTLLQGSIILSSFQFSFAANKDHRFWFCNALRIAMQIGLHRQDLAADLDRNTHKLCRRIWWLLYTRDVLFSLSGFSNARCMDDREIDAAPLTVDDWAEEPTDLAESTKASLPPTTAVHKHYFVQNCQLALLSAEFLRLSRHKKIAAGGLPEVMRFAESILQWRSSLPRELRPDGIMSWSRSNFWIIVLLAMSYRLECIFYRTAREQLRPSDNHEAVSWCTQQLFGATFELDTLLNRAMVHNLVQYAPSSLIVCALNLLAFHIEIALDQTHGTTNNTTAKARIHACLSYLRAMGDSWRIAKWSLRVSEWVVRRAGLALTDVPTGSHTPVNEQAEAGDDGDGQGGQQLSNGDQNIAVSSFDEFGFSVDDMLPDLWMQDFLGESFFNQLDNEYLTF